MLITHRYMGTARGPYRCLFFLLLEDYVEAQTQFVRELDLYLERFARNLGDAGAVVRPFTPDIEAVRTDVMEKNWTHDQREQIKKTPSVLMLNEDFDDFDPGEHPWIHIHFGERVLEGIPGVYQLADTLSALANAVADPATDIFQAVHALLNDVRLSDASKVFEAKPGIFGFSIDLVRGGELVRKIARRWAGRPA